MNYHFQRKKENNKIEHKGIIKSIEKKGPFHDEHYVTGKYFSYLLKLDNNKYYKMDTISEDIPLDLKENDVVLFKYEENKNENIIDSNSICKSLIIKNKKKLKK